MAIKACWFCRFFEFTQKQSDWSEVTPGSDFEIRCGKRHWNFDTELDSQEKFGEVLSSAETCPDFLTIVEPVPPPPHPKYDDIF